MGVSKKNWIGVDTFVCYIGSLLAPGKTHVFGTNYTDCFNNVWGNVLVHVRCVKKNPVGLFISSQHHHGGYGGVRAAYTPPPASHRRQ